MYWCIETYVPRCLSIKSVLYCNLLFCFIDNVYVLLSSQKVPPVKPAPPPPDMCTVVHVPIVDFICHAAASLREYFMLVNKFMNIQLKAMMYALLIWSIKEQLFFVQSVILTDFTLRSYVQKKIETIYSYFFPITKNYLAKQLFNKTLYGLMIKLLHWFPTAQFLLFYHPFVYSENAWLKAPYLQEIVQHFYADMWFSKMRSRLFCNLIVSNERSLTHLDWPEHWWTI